MGAGVALPIAARAPSAAAQAAPNQPLVVTSKTNRFVREEITTTAWNLMQRGGSAMDAAERATNVSERDPRDATVGYGGDPNEDGFLQLDAAVMNGADDNNIGAVAALENIKTPSSIARLVMDRTDHWLLVGRGALRFATMHGFKEEELLTDEARQHWLDCKENSTSGRFPDGLANSSGIVGRYLTDSTLTIGRCAILTEDLNGRPKCHYCGPCSRGCRTGSYYSSVSSSLPAAEATGRLTLIPNAVASHIEVDDAGKCRSVYYVDRITRRHQEVVGKAVVLCAATLESTRIMLNSTSDRYPTGIANSSGALGHYLMDHVTGGGGSGVLPVLKGVPDTRGNRPNGIYIPRFRNLEDRQPDFLRGYGYQGSARLLKWGHAMDIPGFGAAFKQEVRETRPWQISLGGFGEHLPRYENFCELDKTHVDACGIPILHISAAYGENEQKMVERHGRRRRGDAPRRRRRGHRRPPGYLDSRSGHSRGRHGANGRRSDHVGPERLRAGARRRQPVRDGRVGLRLVGVPEPDHHVHGAGHPRLRVPGRAVPHQPAVARDLPPRQASNETPEVGRGSRRQEATPRERGVEPRCGVPGWSEGRLDNGT